MDAYRSNLEHLLEELERIRLLIRRQLQRFRAVTPQPLNQMGGLCIRDDEIDAILMPNSPVVGGSGTSEPLDGILAEMEARIERRKHEAVRDRVALRLERVRELFNLSIFERDALLVCLMPEIDLRYEKVYAYLQDDVTRKRPTVGLVLDLCASVETRFAARESFSRTAPLFAQLLLRMTEDGPDGKIPLLARPLSVDDRIAEYLLGSDRPDARLDDILRTVEPCLSWENLVLPAELKDRLERLARLHVENGTGLMVYLQGPTGAGKETVAASLCRELNIPLFAVDLGRVLHADLALASTATLISREALLKPAALYLSRFEMLLADDEKTRHRRQTLFDDRIAGLPALRFVGSEIPWEPSGSMPRHTFIRIERPLPSSHIRKKLWEACLDGSLPSDLDVAALADKFRLTPGQIQDAACTARNLACFRDPDETRITAEDIYRGCRAHSNQRLRTLARKVEPTATWDQIVLPPDQRNQLAEIVSAVKCRSVVYGDWGFDRRLSLGKGLNILFSGPSGTGKTMAAEIIASELGLDLYKTDLSQVVSKYIGETEKNLDRIFTEAETSNAVLFFDEADALFGKRSQVKEAHDRYANIEIGYLLQKMEEYNGIAILATNVREYMDQAFVRRMHAIVEFPFPDEEYRRRIWEVMFPDEARCDEDVDFGALAKRIRLSGGNIRNIATTAALYAAADGRVIRMPHLMRAAHREYQKLGRSWAESEGNA